MKNIPPLYHWAPQEAEKSIRRHGLRPTVPHRGTMVVCLATTPSEAWALLPWRDQEPEAWDLWQVHVSDTPLHRVKHWERWAEYRIPRAIKPQGLHKVASRPGRKK